jgi:Cu+-exporting ATPase
MTHEHSQGGHSGQTHRHEHASTGKDTDPVCGMTVKPDSPYRAIHAGHEFRFCSAKCQGKFETDPGRYLAPETSQASMEPAPVPGTEYTCPMHPEIRQIGPGTCPKCGMTLEPVMPGLEDDDNPELADFRRRFWWTLPLTVIVTAIAMSGGFFDPMLGAARPWVELALATPVVLWSGWPFFVRCAQSIRNRSPNMWTLIGLGTGAAYVSSPRLRRRCFRPRSAWANTSRCISKRQR